MRHTLLLLVLICLASCITPNKISKKFSKCKSSLAYLHDSKKIDCDRSANISMVLSDHQMLDSLITVSKINRKVWPFIFYNYNEINFDVKLGQNVLEQRYADFFNNSFRIESQRTGCYSLIYNTNKSTYTVEIIFEKCKVNSIYHRNSTFMYLVFLYDFQIEEIGFPSEAELVLRMNLKKGNDLILTKNYSIRKTQSFLKESTMGNFKKIRSDFVSNMTESLSLGTKDSIEEIILDINQALEKQ